MKHFNWDWILGQTVDIVMANFLAVVLVSFLPTAPQYTHYEVAGWACLLVNLWFLGYLPFGWLIGMPVADRLYGETKFARRAETKWAEEQLTKTSGRSETVTPRSSETESGRR